MGKLSVKECGLPRRRQKISGFAYTFMVPEYALQGIVVPAKKDRETEFP